MSVVPPDPRGWEILAGPGSLVRMRALPVLLSIGLSLAACDDGTTAGTDSGVPRTDSGASGTDGGATDAGTPTTDAGDSRDGGGGSDAAPPGTDGSLLPGLDGSVAFDASFSRDGSLLPGRDGSIPGGCATDMDCMSGQMCCMFGGFGVCLRACP